MFIPPQDGTSEPIPPARLFIPVTSDESLPHEPMRRAYRWWRSACVDGRLPNIGLTDAVDLEQIFGHEVTIVDAEHDPQRFRVVRLGPTVREAVGRDLAGLYGDQIPGSENTQERYRWLVRERAPYLANSRLTFSRRQFRAYDVLSLPFVDAANRVCRIVQVLIFEG